MYSQFDNVYIDSKREPLHRIRHRDPGIPVPDVNEHYAY